jgi:selenium metabolism protein YedF
MQSIDCRGLACPAPVLKTKELLENEALQQLTVVVDNEAAKQNVTRFLESRQFTVTVKQEGNDFQVSGKRETACTIPPSGTSEKTDKAERKIMLMVATDRMGRGDDDLGAKLMLNFLATLKEMGAELWRLVFVNSGVKLTATGSPALPALRELESAGNRILVCGTCLNHFNLLEKKAVGETTNMLDIVTAMQLADKVINI